MQQLKKRKDRDKKGIIKPNGKNLGARKTREIHPDNNGGGGPPGEKGKGNEKRGKGENATGGNKRKKNRS